MISIDCGLEFYCFGRSADEMYGDVEGVEAVYYHWEAV